MNCANHPERTATAFCQNCGKAICPECTRTVDGLLLCEPCQAVRGAGHGAPAGAGWNSVPASAGRPGFTPVPGVPASAYARQVQAGPSPVLAGLLGFIPGVGAMYNGQYIKGLIHVVVFIVLVGTAQHWGLAGLLIAAWEFYQVFDAAQTASARRDGRPLPDPFGLLDLSQRLGPMQTSQPQGTPAAPAPPPPPTQGFAGTPGVPMPGAPMPGAPMPGAPMPGAPMPGTPMPGAPMPGAASWPPPPPYGAQAGWTSYPQPAPYAAAPPQRRRGSSFGAIALIVLGSLFLLNTLDVLSFDWIGRGWPLLLLALGIWLLVRRATGTGPSSQVPQGTAGYPAPPAAPPATPPETPGPSVSISPYSEAARTEGLDTPEVREEKP